MTSHAMDLGLCHILFFFFHLVRVLDPITVAVIIAVGACCYWFQSKLTFEYSLEQIIDDWVLMGFLVGNDFIPHLPHIHIHQDCLPLLWQTYKTVLPTLDGWWRLFCV